MVALDLLVVTTSLDTIRRNLDASTASLQWIVTAYGVSFAALLLTGAALGDRFGRRRTMSIGLAVFAVGSAGAALAPSIGVLVAARCLQGVGGAIVLPIGLTIVASTFPPSRRGVAIGVLEGVTGLAVIAGPVLGGAIAHWLPWQWIFWINVPVAVVAIVVVRAVVEETFGPDTTIDLAGLVLVSIAATATVLLLARGNTVGWASAESTAVAAIGLGAAVGFVVWERRATAPMLPRRLFDPAASRSGSPPRSSWLRRCTSRCSSWPSSSRPNSESTTSEPVFGCCRGRRHCSSQHRWPERSPTASDIAPSCRRDWLLRRSGWSGSLSSPADHRATRTSSSHSS